jgi:hypothetical protein
MKNAESISPQVTQVKTTFNKEQLTNAVCNNCPLGDLAIKKAGRRVSLKVPITISRTQAESCKKEAETSNSYFEPLICQSLSKLIKSCS